MADIQEVFNRIQENKIEVRRIKGVYKEMLSSHGEYEETQQKLRGFKLRKFQIEQGVQGQMGKEFEKLEALKRDIDSDQVLMSDMALSTMLKGQSVSVTDGQQNDYEPQFSVKFKKKR